MLLSIGEIIAVKRQEKHITQQALADFIGVTKASVSKWENNQSYPDITLLPLLAAYFDLSIDELLNYHSQLTTTEIKNIYQSLQKAARNSPEVALQTWRQMVRRYYSCYPFILQMGLFLLNHFDLLPGESRAAKQEQYFLEAQKLFRHVATNGTEATEVEQARKFQAYTLLIQGKSAEVLQLLGEQTPTNFPVEPLIAAALQQMGKPQKAIGVLQSSLYQNITVTMSFMTNYLQLLVDQPEKFAATVEKGYQLAELFDLPQLNPIICLNFLASAMAGFAQQQDLTALTVRLKEYVALLAVTKFPVELHGDDYFDQLTSWIAHLELEGGLPRDTVQVKQDFIQLILVEPLFAQVREQPELQPLLQQLATLREEEQDA